MKQYRKLGAAAVAVAVLLGSSVAAPAYADSTKEHVTGTHKLRAAVSAERMVKHLAALQRIADANGGTRAAGTAGFEASAQYIERRLRRAGYEPYRQAFSYLQFSESAEAVLAQVAPTPRTFAAEEFDSMEYSTGDATAAVSAVDINLTGDRASTSGCEAADFAGFPAGNIALLQRGTCAFGVKVRNAQAAGAAGAVIFNQGNNVPGDDRMGVVAGTLGEPLVTIPAVGTSFPIGQELAGTAGLTLRVAVAGSVQEIETFNVLADTGGNSGRTVVVGAHLDSVGEGAGINDNGTGVAAILETAVQLAKTHIRTKNQVRFAFWGGEEDGLQGSNYYVEQLTEEQIADTAVNLNFDMVGSPNFARFVYDGDGSTFGTAGPEGSDRVEDVFNDYFAEQGLPTAPTPFSGRSDYFAFISAGIPAGGLFTGGDGIKTADEAALFGGTAGVPYDACYHKACDDFGNVSVSVLDQMGDAIAHGTLTFAERKRPWHHHWEYGRGPGHPWEQPGHHDDAPAA